MGLTTFAKRNIFAMMKVRNPELFRLHADFCKILANPTRLMVMAILSHGEMSVGELARACETALPAVSQHLKTLKNHHMVVSRKEGQSVFYTATDPRLMEACTLIRTVLLDGMRKRGEIANMIDPAGVTVDD
jgi:ArsR family transcriptional regulator